MLAPDPDAELTMLTEPVADPESVSFTVPYDTPADTSAESTTADTTVPAPRRAGVDDG